MRVAALVMAAGSGSRFGARKQFLELGPGERLVDRTVATAAAASSWVCVVLPPGHGWDGAPVDASCSGGATRYASMQAGLALIPDDADVVLIHSASHPLASPDLARRVVAGLGPGVDGVVPFLEAVDVIKRREAGGALRTVGREGFGSAQCPMAFSRSVLTRAVAESETGIEESQVVEAIGGTVIGVEGEVTNLHVVDGQGLALARAIAAL